MSVHSAMHASCERSARQRHRHRLVIAVGACGSSIATEISGFRPVWNSWSPQSSHGDLKTRPSPVDEGVAWLDWSGRLGAGSPVTARQRSAISSFSPLTRWLGRVVQQEGRLTMVVRIRVRGYNFKRRPIPVGGRRWGICATCLPTLGYLYSNKKCYAKANHLARTVVTACTLGTLPWGIG